MKRRSFLQRSALFAALSPLASLAPSSPLGGLLHAEQASAVKPRSLFDGMTLKGWHVAPRIVIPNNARFNALPSDQLRDAVIQFNQETPAFRDRLTNTGVWQVQDGAITGGQVPGTGLGAYLLSDEKFGNFELTLDARPDWPTDTGIMIRAHELGGIGFQVLIDHRPGGAIGGIYGNGVGGFRGYPFNVDADEQDGFRIANLREGTADGPFIKPDLSASLADFLSVWKPNDWNTFRIRSTGHLPVIETWINGMGIARLDTAKLADRVPGYDPAVISERLGTKGHIGLEVHDNGKMGRARWAPGAVCRWRNISITEL